MGKRMMDLCLAALGLALFAPLILILALAIKLDSTGPVFFRQERVGRHGRVFRIHKFRTMRHEPTKDARQITIGADPRITRVGAWIRKRRLDEIPQLIDVIKGDMSIVGPRPEVPRYVAHYPQAVREKVLALRPGITDPASLAFRHEAELLAAAADPEREYVEVIMPQKLRHAIAYAEQASVWTDLKLIGRTLKVLASG
ncbi:MAG TPA: sugar transferase [Burkholderiaceae bacterium]|nr:sugar transferase [Burkholderiaceae bacterium]